MKRERMNYQLIKPNIKYIDSYIDAITEGSYTPMQGDFGNVKAELVERDPQSFINYLNSKTPIPMNYLGQQYSISNHELFWLVSSAQFIASVALRYDHNCPPLTEAYGHIGVSARPALINKGCAARGYIKHLPTIYSKFKDNGFKQITLSCEEDNVSSKRMIEHTGGIFNGKKELTTGTMLIYKLDLA
jgi:predicted acetyltransferase